MKMIKMIIIMIKMTIDTFDSLHEKCGHSTIMFVWFASTTVIYNHPVGLYSIIFFYGGYQVT
jgi:hypothetical protein